MTANLVLLVEDNSANQKLALAVLARGGYRVVLASSAAEVRAKLREITPDVVLMDIQLGDGNGLDLTREIKAAPATARIMVSNCAGLTPPLIPSPTITSGAHVRRSSDRPILAASL